MPTNSFPTTTTDACVAIASPLPTTPATQEDNAAELQDPPTISFPAAPQDDIPRTIPMTLHELLPHVNPLPTTVSRRQEAITYLMRPAQLGQELPPEAGAAAAGPARQSLLHLIQGALELYPGEEEEEQSSGQGTSYLDRFL